MLNGQRLFAEPKRRFRLASASPPYILQYRNLT